MVTGGGPGIMEAANRGARDAGGRSIGCNIELGPGQKPNAYLDRWITFRHFFVRKVMLVKYSYAFLWRCPGASARSDEIFETATLIQTHKIENFRSSWWDGTFGARSRISCTGPLRRMGLVDALDADRHLARGRLSHRGRWPPCATSRSRASGSAIARRGGGGS